ncbi:MAG TPA: polysaccharide deacetylase family protein [Polyangiaceae bacterium]|nr:polysaccharide deacetylase family protein [Polyangiaceae bacterium]
MRIALALLTLLTVGCSSGSGARSATAAGGQGGTTGTASSAGDSSTVGSAGGGGASSALSGLPLPSRSGVAQPAGSAGNLQILPWAGFQAAVSYTFDDAQPSQIEHWAELKAEGIRGTFYLNTRAQATEADFDSTWQDAEAQGWELGNHTVHHCNADGTCPNGATFTSIDQEFDDVTTYITTTGQQAAAWTAAYPYGDTGYEPAAEERFFLARGVSGGLVAANDSTDPFDLPCIAAVAAGGEPVSTFSGDVDAAHAQGKWLIFLFHTILPTDQSWYAPTDIGSITGSMEHAKSLPDVWLDSLVNVGAYWLAQKLVSAVTPTMNGGATTWAWSLPAHFPSGKYLRVTVDGGTLTQSGSPLPWDEHGFYEVSLDAGTLTLTP